MESWIADTFSTSIGSLSLLDLAGIECSAERGTGVILINWGPVLEGKLSVLLIGTPEQQRSLRSDFLTRNLGV